MAKPIWLFDCDGCVYEGAGSAPAPGRIAQELLEFLRTQAPQVGFITGQPWHVARQLPQQLGFEPAFIGPDYGGVLYGASGERLTVLIPTDEANALHAARPLLVALFRDLNGQLDDARGAEFNCTFFFRTLSAFNRAKRVFEKAGEYHQVAAPGGRQLLRVQWNEIDFSVNFLPASSCKGVAAAWIANSYTIERAAGDTGSDLPMLRLAKRGILTHDGGGPNKALAAQVREMGGLVAPADKPHGYGLLHCLRLAS